MSDEPASADIRASDGERDAVASRLNDAVGKGELTLTEFSTRVEQAYAAKTRGELEGVVADLKPAPGTDSVPAPAPVAAAPGGEVKTSWHVALIGGISRKGHWRVPRKTISVSIIGGADLDMRGAQLEAPRVEFTKISLIGGISLTVPPGVRVEVDGVTIVGGKDIKQDQSALHANAPVVHLRVFCLFGGASVRTKP